MLLSLFFLAAQGPAWAVFPVPAKPAVPASSAAPAVSTAAPTTVGELYRSERLRDPFVQISRASAARSYGHDESAVFSIHRLVLKGLMRDKGGDWAMLNDTGSSEGYILKNGRLYDSKKKPVSGVTGRIQLKQKTVHLMTPEKDVQTLILGEDEEGQ